MKTSLFTIIILCLIAICTFAQQADNRPKISIGNDIGLLVGPAENKLYFASSLLFKFQYPVSKLPLYVTLTAGYSGYLTKGNRSYINFSDGDYGPPDGYVASFIPVEAGARAYLSKQFFVEGDLGLAFKESADYYNDLGKKTAVIYVPMIGYSFPVGRSSAVDMILRYEGRINAGLNISQVAVGAAFNLGL